MENKNNNIDRYLKDRLGEFELKPPDTSWDIIAKKLDNSKKNGMLLFIFRVAAGMAILISTAIVYNLLTKPVSQPGKAVLSINQNEPDFKDTFNLKKPNKRNIVPAPEKKDNISDRPEPVRKVNKGPATSAGIDSKYDAQHDLVETTGKAVNSVAHYQLPALTRIVVYNRQYLLPVYLPSTLSHIAVSHAKTLTTEEAMALLLPATGETTEPDVKKQDHWTLGSEIAPLYSHRGITSDHELADKINELNQNESGLLAYAGGIRVAFVTGKRFSVQSGIYYSRYGQDKNKIETYNYNYNELTSGSINSSRYISVYNSTGIISSEYPESTGYGKVIANTADATSELSYLNGIMGIENSEKVPTEDLDVTLTQYFDYLELPLLVKYKIIDRKFDVSMSGGLVTNFLVGNAVNIKQDGETSRFGETTNISQVNYQTSFGLGFEYPLVSGFAITVEPRFRYFINPVEKSAQLNVHPYSFGFFAGINYTFYR